MGLDFFSHISTKTTYFKRSNAKGVMIIQVISVRPNIKKIQKYKIMPHFSQIFLFGKIKLFCSKHVLDTNM